VRIRIFDDAGRLADAAAREIEAWLRLTGPPADIGLAGGHTPRATYERLREVRLPWKEVHAWLTDERSVPSDDPESNAGMARRILFDHVPATLHEVPWMEDPNAAAEQYEKELHRVLEPDASGPRPGLVLLGVGEDGHTASLFPGTEALEAHGRDFTANWVPGIESWRLTATIGLLQRARRTMFLVAGRRKAAVVAEVLEGNSDLPAALVGRRSRDAVWLLDRDAAAGLSQA
jgi:6-phosphogluconolactonase